MKKFLFIVIVSLLAGIYSPSIVKSWTTTAIQVRDGVSHNPISGAEVLLFARNGYQNVYERYSVFNGVTDLNGVVDIDQIFYNYYNVVNLEYEVYKYGYVSLWGGKTFYRGEWTVLDMRPRSRVPACGRRGCQYTPAE